MRVRLYHARVISFANGDTELMENMQVGIENGKILFVCSDEDMIKTHYIWDEER